MWRLFLSLAKPTPPTTQYMASLLVGLKVWGGGRGRRQGPHLDLIHISNPGPGLSKSLLESLDVGQVNRDVFCLVDYGLECGWWMLLPEGREKRASIWGGLSDQKPSLTTRYSGVSPGGCHVGLLACIVPHGWLPVTVGSAYTHNFGLPLVRLPCV